MSLSEEQEFESVCEKELGVQWSLRGVCDFLPQ